MSITAPYFGNYRARAAKALGRPLRRGEVVHHHSGTQLVICDAAYHGWLHRTMRAAGIQHPRRSFNCFLLRGIDAEVFKQARARCLSEDLRLVDVISQLLRDWLKPIR